MKLAELLTADALSDARFAAPELAGVSADSDDLWQVGIDVEAAYRGLGIGQALVYLVTEAVCSQGKVPYYATAASNLASRNVAHRVGYLPCWVEVGSYERSRFERRA